MSAIINKNRIGSIMLSRFKIKFILPLLLLTLFSVGDAVAEEEPPALFAPTAVSLDEVGDAWDKVSDMIALKGMTDEEKWVFQSIFGDIPFLRSSSSVNTNDTLSLSPLAQLGGWTNIIGLVFILVISSYAISAGVVNSANSGEVLGKKWSSSWVFMKTSIGSLMLIPIQGMPISSAQLMVIYIAAIGSVAGTSISREAKDIFLGGGSDSPVIVNISPMIVKDLNKMLMCADENTRKEASFIERYTSVFSTPKKIPLYTYVYSDESRVPSSSVPKNHVTISSLNPFVKPDKSLIDIDFGDCGSISFPSPDDVDFGNDIKQPDMSSAGEDKVEILKDSVAKNAAISTYTVVISTLNALAANAEKTLSKHSVLSIYLYALKDESEPSKELRDSMQANANGLATIMSNFPTNIKTSFIGMTAIDRKKIAEEYEANMKSDSWFYFASMMFDLMRISQYPVAALENTLSDMESPESSSCLYATKKSNPSEEEEEFYDECLKKLTGNDAERAGEGLLGDIFIANAINNGKYQESSGSERGPEQAASSYVSDRNLLGKSTIERLRNNTDCTELVCGGAKATASGLLAEPMGYVSGIINSAAWLGSHRIGDNEVKSSLYDMSGQSNPFIFAMNLGTAINTGTMAMWASGMAISSLPAGGAVGFFTGGSIKGMLGYLAATLAVLMIALIPVGVTLAYVIPLIPLVGWITSVAGWVLSTVEAFLAIPFAFALMALPEGEGIFGSRLERAIALIARILLYPPLLVLGMVTAMTASNIIFTFYNSMFFGYSEITTYNPIGFIAMLGSYTMVLFFLCKYIYSFVAKVVDQILEWMSGGIARKFGEDDATGALAEGLGQTAGTVQTATTAGLKK